MRLREARRRGADHDLRQPLLRGGSLDEVLDLDVLRRSARTATGEKFLIVP